LYDVAPQGLYLNTFFSRTVALPFVPQSVTAPKKPTTASVSTAAAAAAVAPTPLKRKQPVPTSDAPLRNNGYAPNVAGSEQLPSKKARTDLDFTAEIEAQIHAEKEYGVTYAFDNRPRPPRGGKGRAKKEWQTDDAGPIKQFDVTQYVQAVCIGMLKESILGLEDMLIFCNRISRSLRTAPLLGLTTSDGMGGNGRGRCSQSGKLACRFRQFVRSHRVLVRLSSRLSHWRLMLTCI
jgi:hypothetical protein